jgi:hypothetical protein
MTVINKTVEIPQDRRLRLEIELPPNMPIGEANIQITITPIDKRSPKEIWEALSKLQGVLKDSPTFQGNSVDIVRKWRDE